MPKKGDVDVVPGEKGWRGEIEGTGRARSTNTTQAEAAQAARRVARQSKAEALPHRRNEKIRDRSTYGKDPRRRTKGSARVPRAEAVVTHRDEPYSKYIDGCGWVTVRRDKTTRWRVTWTPDDPGRQPVSLSRADVALPLDFPIGDDPADLLWWAERYFATW